MSLLITLWNWGSSHWIWEPHFIVHWSSIPQSIKNIEYSILYDNMVMKHFRHGLWDLRFYMNLNESPYRFFAGLVVLDGEVIHEKIRHGLWWSNPTNRGKTIPQTVAHWEELKFLAAINHNCTMCIFQYHINIMNGGIECNLQLWSRILGPR